MTAGQTPSAVQRTTLLRLKVWSLLLVFGAVPQQAALNSSWGRNMSHSAAMWLINVFLIVFGQRRSTAQRNKIYQTLDTNTILVSRMSSLLFKDITVSGWVSKISPWETSTPNIKLCKWISTVTMRKWNSMSDNSFRLCRREETDRNSGFEEKLPVSRLVHRVSYHSDWPSVKVISRVFTKPTIWNRPQAKEKPPYWWV